MTHQRWNELFYLDAAQLVVVDHPAGTDAYTTMTNYLNKGSTGQIYTVNSYALLSHRKYFAQATNRNGENVLPHILQRKTEFTRRASTMLKANPSWDNTT